LDESAHASLAASCECLHLIKINCLADCDWTKVLSLENRLYTSACPITRFYKKKRFKFSIREVENAVLDWSTTMTINYHGSANGVPPAKQ
jgi:hypothetical protein